MLLRIDKIAGSQEGPSGPPSDPPIHVCLATATVQGANNNAAAATQQNGEDGSPDVVPGTQQELNPSKFTGDILTIGRKNCGVVIEDKSMSRSHATLALLSNDESLVSEDALAAANTLLDGRLMMEYGKPTTPEEIYACETSDTGVICVVRDKGSKFGTFISVDKKLLAEYSPKKDDEAANGKGGGDETGDDETDDEGAAATSTKLSFHDLSPKQLRAVSCLSKDKTLKFQQVEKNSSTPLLQLSHTKASGVSHPQVIILFGPQGSAVSISLLPLQFTFSRIKKAELDPLLASLHYIGATNSTQWDVQRSTHLIAPEKTAAAKGIMAWACRKPVVLPGYIEALLGRTDAQEELPKEDDYCPRGDWDSKLKWTPEPCDALKGYRIAVLLDDDNGPLALSAGGEVLHIYEDAPTSSKDEFDTWWATQTQKALDDKRALVVVTTTSKKCKQFTDWLKHKDGVIFTNPKNLAQAITNKNGEGQLLCDTKKEEIQKIEGWDTVVEEARKEDDDDDQKMPAADTSMDVDVSAETAEKEVAEKEDAPLANEDDPKEQEEEKEVPKSTRRKRRQEEEEVDKAEEQVKEKQKSPKRRRKNKEKEAPVEEEEVRPAEEEEVPIEEEEVEEPAPKQKKKQVVDESSDDEPGLPTERIALPKTDDGWLVTAPKKRKAYRKDVRAEDADVDEDMPEISAETEKVSLIVRKYVPLAQRGGGNRGAARSGGKKKKDFKRFRKNAVIRGYTTFNSSGNERSLPKISLVVELPKESERQRQLQQQQEDLEREQELADQLFNDVGPKTGRKRKQGSMNNFLSQKSTTTKKGRGRR